MPFVAGSSREPAEDEIEKRESESLLEFAQLGLRYPPLARSRVFGVARLIEKEHKIVEGVRVETQNGWES